MPWGEPGDEFRSLAHISNLVLGRWVSGLTDLHVDTHLHTQVHITHTQRVH